MHPGKRAETKLNILPDESATEKLARSQVFLWLLNNTRLALGALALLVVLFLVAALWFTKKDARFQEDYIKIETNIEKIRQDLVQGKNQDALSLWQETKPLISGYKSFAQAFQAESAELLLLLENYDEALPLMQATLKRTRTSLGEAFIPFIEITEKTDPANLQAALVSAKQLADNKDSEMPIMLRAYNILQIPAFARALDDKKEELDAINKVLSLIESRGDLGNRVHLLSQMIQSEKTTYLDYLRSRKSAL